MRVAYNTEIGSTRDPSPSRTLLQAANAHRRVARCLSPTIPEKEDSNQFETSAVRNDHDKPKTNTKNTLDRGPE